MSTFKEIVSRKTKRPFSQEELNNLIDSVDRDMEQAKYDIAVADAKSRNQKVVILR